jgi:TonB family protein
VQSAAKKSESAKAQAAGHASVPTSKKAKLSVLLITRDDTLWPQIGVHLSSELILKQVDSVDELCTATPAGQPAIVLWDARGHSDADGVLSRLQLHSTRFAVIALDESADAWTNPIALRQIVAHVAVPILAEPLKTALDNGSEEVNARTALLGSGAAAPEHRSAVSAGTSGPRKMPWIPVSIILVVLTAFGAAFMLLRHGDTLVKPAIVGIPQSLPQPGSKGPEADERADLFIEKAQQAMLDRHFIEPAEGSALSLYRKVLVLDPDNGEARQGLQRLAEILFARVQSALDERKIDVALQSLETARSISPNDSRLGPLDERIASLRAEFGPAQILAAINAQNFDRAAQLIDDAARAKSLNSAKLAQLRDELHRRRQEFDIANFMKLADTRLQQDKLTEPRNDSAAFYLAQARTSGATAAALQAQTQEFYKRMTQSLHAAIDQRRLSDADRTLADLRSSGAPAVIIAGLQHDLNAARQPTLAMPEQPQYLELAQSRLAQGKVTEPDNDSALYYVTQLRAADPKNSGLARMVSAVQAQILDQARTALDTLQPARAESLLQMAASLGTTTDLVALNQRLAQVKQAAAGTPEVNEATLTRVKGIELDYPTDALRKEIEGWVDLSYLVTGEGKVTSVKILGSSPAGVFDAAATRAVSRVRYAPMAQAGKSAVVSTKLRIAFRLKK